MENEGIDYCCLLGKEDMELRVLSLLSSLVGLGFK